MALTFKKILVPIDFSEISLKAIDYAAYIAAQFDASVTLLHVIETYKYNSALKLNPKMGKIIHDGIRFELKDLIKNTKSLKGVVVKTLIVEGKIYNGIINTAKSKQFDLVVMGTHGSSGIKNVEKFMLGANAYRVVHSSVCPVITVKEKKTNIQFKNILLPIDLTREVSGGLKKAVAIAQTFNSNIHVVSVSTTLDEYIVDYARQVEKMNKVKEYLKKCKIPHTAHIIRDMDITDGVLYYGKKINADLIVIMNSEKGILKNFLIGSNAREIITNSRIPVYTLMPEPHRPYESEETLYRKSGAKHGEFAVKETLQFYY